MIYFDNAATTKPYEAALKAFNNTALSTFGNSSSLHKFGLKSELEIQDAEKNILKRLSHDCSFPKEGKLIFTSGATESNNMAIRGVAELMHRKGKKIITTKTEHASVSNVMDSLISQGFDILKVNPYDNNVEQQIADLTDKDTILISAIAVNNETGFKIDTKKLFSLVKEKNKDTIIHIDAVQAFCKLPVYGDLISISAHKIHGIKGVGGLFIQKGIKLPPLILGGEHQNGLRAGTLPTELITAFSSAACEYPYDNSHIVSLRKYFEEKISEFDNIVINSKNSIPDIINFSILNIKSEIMLHYLEQHNIFVSGGSACSKGRRSNTLLGYGLPNKAIDSALRVSFSHQNTFEEIDQFFKILSKGIERFSKLKVKG